MTPARLLVLSLLVAGLAAAPTLARNGNGDGNGQGHRDTAQQCTAYCDGSGSYCTGTGLCDGSGTCTATPRRDGSGKAFNSRGNPHSTGTPLKDGSGKTTAPGKGAKDGTGPNANCPNASGS